MLGVNRDMSQEYPHIDLSDAHGYLQNLRE